MTRPQCDTPLILFWHYFGNRTTFMIKVSCLGLTNTYIVTSHGGPTPTMVFLPFWVRPLNDHIKPQKMLDFNLETLILSMHGISFIFRNNLNGSWDFYHVPMCLMGSSMAINTMAKICKGFEVLFCSFFAQTCTHTLHPYCCTWSFTKWSWQGRSNNCICDFTLCLWVCICNCDGFFVQWPNCELSSNLCMEQMWKMREIITWNNCLNKQI